MSEAAAPRALVCARCGATFECRPEGDCWCSRQSFRLPLPGPDSPLAAFDDCLCPACLETLARAARPAEEKST